nr:hypothetical protein [Brevibacillus laterosporus]
MIQKKAIFHVLVSTSLLTSLGLPSYVSAAVENQPVQSEQVDGSPIAEAEKDRSNPDAENAGTVDDSGSQSGEGASTVDGSEPKTEEGTDKVDTPESKTEEGTSQVGNPTPQPNPESVDQTQKATTIDIESVQAISDSTYPYRTFASNCLHAKPHG